MAYEQLDDTAQTTGDRVDLTGLWRFQPDAFDDGERLGYQRTEADVRLWREVAVPCAFDDVSPQLTAYEGRGWFRRTFHVPASWLGQHVVLRFEGVNYDATVWVNGSLAGGHEGGFLRFEIPVSNLLVSGRNDIVVRADNTRRHGAVPGMERGWRPYGGILREVVALCRPLMRLENPSIRARADGRFDARVTVRNDTDTAQSAGVSLDIVDSPGRTVAICESARVRIPSHSAAVFELGNQADAVTPWTPELPVLYTATFHLGPAELEDEIKAQIGFRTVERRGPALLLNGQPLHLQGFNRHEDSPQTGMKPDPEQVERDMRHMKQLGANFVRLCHYPHHPLELDLCDSLGLLAMVEIPLYWWNGDADGDQRSETKLATAKRQLSEMIVRDINHPSIIFWSVSNETHEQRPEVSAGNAALIEHVRSLDASRLAVHVANQVEPGVHFEQDDVICINGYPTWDGRGWKSNPDYDLAQSKRWWDARLERLHAAYPDRPILVTEFGYPALYGVFDNGLAEDMQSAQLQSEAAAFDKPYVCGMTIWCYADHPWPEEPFLQYLTNSPFGVVTRDRRPKKAVAAVQALFNAPRPATSAIAQDESLDNVPVTMIRPNLRDIPEVPFPAGFGVRPLRRNEGGLWEDIWRDAEPFFKIENGLFDKEFGDDPGAVERRCFIITAPDGVAAGTISSWYARDLHGQDFGRIHWVATRKAYQGKGIMRAGLSYALKQMAQWHERAVLDTSTGRLAAIKLYLDFGFIPDLRAPRAREAWTGFRARLDHAALAMLDEP